MLPRHVLLSFAAFFTLAKFSRASSSSYYGKYLGKIKTLHHGVSGEVFAVDARTLHIRDFTYDGEGPAAYFYAGNSKNPSASGFRMKDEKGSSQPLQRYHKKHVTITLPDGKNLNTIKWVSVWCDEFSVNFGDVKIPKNPDYPKPQKIDALRGVHQVSSDPVVVVDAQTLLVPNFSYDGEAPDAKFWVGQGSKPSSNGVRVQDENGKEVPLRRYDHKTIVLTLPGDLSIFDIGHFGVWCEAFAVDFGHIPIPHGLNVPPSLKMLGVAPQKRVRSLELAPDQTRNQQLMFNKPEQHTFGGGVPSGDPFIINHYKNENFHQNHQQASLISSSTNIDVRPTTYKPTINTLRHLHSNQQQQQNHLQRRQESYNLLSFQTLTQQRAPSTSIEIVPSISVSDTFLGYSSPTQQSFQNTFLHSQNLETQQRNTFLQPDPNNFNNQQMNLQLYQQRKNQHNDIANSNIHSVHIPSNKSNSRSFSRISFNGVTNGQSFVQYK